MATRIIKKGETLSGIAGELGTNIQELLKLNPNITNPNLIYTGSNLNIPGVSPAPVPTSPVQNAMVDRVGGVTPIPTNIQNILGGQTGGQTPAPTDDFTKRKTEVDTLIQDILRASAARPSAFDLFKKQEEEQGLPALREKRAQLSGRLGQTLNLLDKLEGDINAQVRGELVTEGGRRRLLAREQEPLTRQVGELERTLGTLSEDITGRESLARSMAGLAAEEGKRPLEDLLTRARLEKELLPERPKESFNIFGSAEEGRFRFNPRTGEYERITEPKAETIGGDFSRDETNTGAARANVNLEDFGRFSPEAKNIFVNNYARITDLQDFIRDNLQDEELEPSEIERIVSEDASLPAEVKDFLVRYLKSLISLTE